jgi:D-alanine-D-alanine ligase
VGYQVTEADIGPDDLAALDHPADVVFPVLHGPFGEDGQLQAILEARGLRYIGSDARSSRIAMDKDASKRAWQTAGLPTSPWATFDGPEASLALPAGLVAPVVIKPLTEGSSIGVSIVDRTENLDEKLKDAVQRYGRVLVEKALVGPELTVGILGDRALPILQVQPPAGFYDFEAKYKRNDTAYRFDPEIDSETYARVQEIALAAFRALGCRDLSRVDFIVDRTTGPQLLEINTLPGFTDHSLLPKAAAHAGIGFDQLVQMLVAMAFERGEA